MPRKAPDAPRQRKEYVYHGRYRVPPSWYNPDATIAEMSDQADCSEAAIRVYLNKNKLPYKKVNKHVPAEKWYDPCLTVPQMCIKSGMSDRAVRIYLKRHNLPFVKLNTPEIQRQKALRGRRIAFNNLLKGKQ
jgi:hypothetical protein